MRQEAMPRKRNFLEMAALLELCGVSSGGRVITILMELSRRTSEGALDTDIISPHTGNLRQHFNLVIVNCIFHGICEIGY